MPVYANGYSYRKLVTVDRTKMSGSADLTNFPVLLSVTDTALRTTGNGGRVQSSTGLDIRVETTGGVKLDHEVEKWSATTGAFVAWVRIPTLTIGADTQFYLYYGNASVSASEQNKTGVWDANYVLVDHFGDGTTLSTADSTSNANTGSGVNSPTAATGKTGGGIGLVKSSSQYVAIPDAANLRISGAITVEAWVYGTGYATDTIYGVLDKGGTAYLNGYFLRVGDTGVSGKPQFAIGDGTTSYTVTGPSALSASTWYRIVGTYDGTTLRMYVNGALVASVSLSITMGTNTNALNLSFNYDGRTFDGTLDEVRISKVVRAAGWLGTEYTNQNAPSSFVSYSAEQTPTLTADHLTVDTQPTTPIASGTVHATQPAGAIRDSSGNIVTTDNSTVVTATFITNSGTASGFGTLSTTAVNGLWSFAGKGLGGTSAGGATAHWWMQATGLTYADTITFTITAPASAADPFIVVAGITVVMAEGTAVEDVEQGGSSERSFAGTLLSDCPWEKRVWKATTSMLTRADVATLKAAIAFRAHVTCSGLAFGTTVTCEVTWSNGGYITTATNDGSSILRSLALVFREV